MKVMHKGFNYSQDGRGNRLVYHLQGCNMRCPWCANPEGMAVNGTLQVSEKDLLEQVCPLGAIQNNTLNREICKHCKERPCLSKSKNKGIWLSYQEVAVDKLVEEAVAAKDLFFEGGGVTFSGGEATLQFEELKEALFLLKEKGIHTAIETNGTHPRLEELFPLIDELIMDFKQANEEKHLQYTGLSTRNVRENLKKATRIHKDIHVRIPLIAEFNGDLSYIPEFLEFFTSLDCRNIRFEFLKYHEYGKTKWLQCGMEYGVQNGFVTDELRETYEEAFRKANLTVVRT